MPFQEPHATYEYLRQLAERQPGATVVFADDGEKFGTWPETYDHVYTHGWLRRFCDMIVATATGSSRPRSPGPSTSTLPLGKVYLPDGSYREMTEWALPAERAGGLPGGGQAGRRRPGRGGSEAVRPGRRVLAELQGPVPRERRDVRPDARASRSGWPPSTSGGRADPDYLEAARQELYRGQCNCPYWHGAFGGLYLPHLRNAIYRRLIAAHNALDDAEGGRPRAVDRSRRLQPRRPPGSPARERPADRLRPPRDRGARLRAGRAATR